MPVITETNHIHNIASFCTGDRVWKNISKQLDGIVRTSIAFRIRNNVLCVTYRKSTIINNLVDKIDQKFAHENIVN